MEKKNDFFFQINTNGFVAFIGISLAADFHLCLLLWDMFLMRIHYRIAI